MKILPIILLVLCASSAFAGKPSPPPKHETAITTTVQVVQTQERMSQAQEQIQQTTQLTDIAPVTLTSENSLVNTAAGGDGGKGGKSSATINNVTPDDIRIRNNGAIALSSPSINAPCWVGYGGAIASGRGTISLFPARRDPACMAMLQFEQLVNLGLVGPAAKAYCSEYKSGVMRKRDGFWKPFGSVEQCQAGIIAALEARVVTDSIVVTIDVDADEPQTCVTTGTNVKIDIQDPKTGEMRVYDCGEIRGKGGAPYR